MNNLRNQKRFISIKSVILELVWKSAVFLLIAIAVNIRTILQLGQNGSWDA